MKYSIVLVAGCLMTSLACGAVKAEEEVTELKRQVAELEARLNLAERTVELLEKESEMLRAENAKLKGEAAPSSTADDSDPFQVGVVWVGEAKAAGKSGKWAISIAERDGSKLSGVAAIMSPDGKKFEIPVSGTAPVKGNGLVVLETPLVGRAKIFFRGRLLNGEIALAFSGTTRLGDKMFGSATLRPKN